MGKSSQPQSEMLKGTLDMMILRTLVGGDAHGHTIAKVIEQTSEDLLDVEQGSLYPALHRLEDRKWGIFLLGSKRRQSQSEVLPADARRP
jgi:PadR family transcriptional regulator PadR